MEAASRPAPEPLADLPVEAPLDAPTPPSEPSAAPEPAAAPLIPVVAPAPAADVPESASPQAASESATPPAAAALSDSSPTGLNFVDPELFLAAGQQPTAIPLGGPGKVPDPPAALELEDPVVEDLLTSPSSPPPPAVAPAKPAPLALTPAHPTPARTAPAAAMAESRSARVPIAKTASLSAAATKLAAAQRSTPKPAAKPAAPEIPAATAAPTLHAAAPAPAQTPAKLDAPSLASWASARAAASAAAKTAPAAPAPAAAATPPAARSAVPKPVTVAPAPAPAPASAPAVMPSPSMDRDFIARNQVVERYLSGRLPLRAATDFERFCHQHPELLDQIGLPERVNAGVRLLEASGKPEPWQEASRPAWQKPGVTIGLAVAVAVLGLGLAIVSGDSASKSHKIATLKKRATEQALDPATSTRSIRLLPSRSGASNAPAITIGGASAELADLKIDEARSAYRIFRVTIDRIDQGRVGVITNLTKDSNGHLRIALNSSALGPGNYQFTFEGIDSRGEPQPDSWVTIGVAR